MALRRSRNCRSFDLDHRNWCQVRNPNWCQVPISNSYLNQLGTRQGPLGIVPAARVLEGLEVDEDLHVGELRAHLGFERLDHVVAGLHAHVAGDERVRSAWKSHPWRRSESRTEVMMARSSSGTARSISPSNERLMSCHPVHRIW